jgi:enoyl-[acyl-carrier-protein] reductase (NADH)
MQPSNLANVILFLASDAAMMINGASIPVDQGVSTLVPNYFSSGRLAADSADSGVRFE